MKLLVPCVGGNPCMSVEFQHFDMGIRKVTTAHLTSLLPGSRGLTVGKGAAILAPEDDGLFDEIEGERRALTRALKNAPRQGRAKIWEVYNRDRAFARPTSFQEVVLLEEKGHGAGV